MEQSTRAICLKETCLRDDTQQAALLRYDATDKHLTPGIFLES
ncbi:hypothetical protein GWA01_10960 [Gluconobacter wancherniae NBRC 103581]|uniref:Uncharacterized protein n=1 Tax=Gluconobacter wancherniae NBRC 103581 TaxID=656744 RepID=A0A511AYS3_9PROT|nr:hypothetical protein AA103581_2209 [Gluconobacter wancherniae NBRC 103581]GEK93326.1 hypothetical protein GWA01_10960 [Gluconobacter wancherniae NBRC 103581]